MTKREYLDSLPSHRKARLHIMYLEYNKYYDDLEQYYGNYIENGFDESDFDSYEIADMLERHSSCLSDEEWEIYQELDNDEDLLF